jgi:hypothetical protein
MAIYKNLQQQEDKNDMKTKTKKPELPGSDTVLDTTLYRKLHGEEPSGLAPCIHYLRRWNFCPAFQLEQNKLLLSSLEFAGPFEKAQARARKRFAEYGVKRVAVIPPYSYDYNKGKGLGNGVRYLSPEEYFAREAAKAKVEARREAKRRAERKAKRMAKGK